MEASDLTSNNSDQWHSVGYSSQKMILEFNTKFATKLMTASFWPLLKSFKHGNTI